MAIRLIRPVHLNVSRTMEKLLQGPGISVAERPVLELLCEKPLTVPEAARQLSMKRQFVQRIATGLVSKGLVEKTPNPEHRRAHFCAPAAAGRDLFGAIHRRELEMLHAMLGDINETDVVVALRVMMRVDSAFESLVEANDGREEKL
ncbi:Transcriptional regulator, MarR family [Sinorhizobium sojae CCBAU 05684]|uniref:Transcriptional regulator, MarR family n=1 Tax=Sinorhizobium sojae CCBAU 05684 TaxID=716928 RepID=A0A249PG04_9HYPH|nr:MarR family transcriptional regulator [Sinorhizobium sojae]ASY64695.1 Transcriptional regulator, MarR family [Sinorhizobium sojae CCBAU 05684]